MGWGTSLSSSPGNEELAPKPNYTNWLSGLVPVSGVEGGRPEPLAARTPDYYLFISRPRQSHPTPPPESNPSHLRPRNRGVSPTSTPSLRKHTPPRFLFLSARTGLLRTPRRSHRLSPSCSAPASLRENGGRRSGVGEVEEVERKEEGSRREWEDSWRVGDRAAPRTRVTHTSGLS